jgi:HSP20 family protein
MTLMRWEPWKSMFKGFPFETEMTLSEWIPTVDIEETREEYVIKAELPGLKKEEVKVTYKDGTLTLSGERKQEKEEKGKRFHRIERSYGTFYRSFAIPEEVEEAKIIAEQKDGVLFVHLPKSLERKEKEKTIEVKVR